MISTYGPSLGLGLDEQTLFYGSYEKYAEVKKFFIVSVDCVGHYNPERTLDVKLWWDLTTRSLIWYSTEDKVHKAFTAKEMESNEFVFDNIIGEGIESGMSLDDIFSYLDLVGG